MHYNVHNILIILNLYIYQNQNQWINIRSFAHQKNTRRRQDQHQIPLSFCQHKLCWAVSFSNSLTCWSSRGDWKCDFTALLASYPSLWSKHNLACHWWTLIQYVAEYSVVTTCLGDVHCYLQHSLLRNMTDVSMLKTTRTEPHQPI